MFKDSRMSFKKFRPEPVDKAAVNDILGDISHSLGQMERSLVSLGSSCADLSAQVPTSTDVSLQIRILHRRVQQASEDQQARLRDIRLVVDHGLKLHLARTANKEVKAQVHRELELQVRDACTDLLRDLIPVSLEEQRADLQRQSAEIERCLYNSESRRKNQRLRRDHLYEPIQLVLLEDTGKPSLLFPHTLAVLFSYHNSRLDALLRDYGLEPGASTTKNQSQFMSHIGMRIPGE